MKHKFSGFWTTSIMILTSVALSSLWVQLALAWRDVHTNENVYSPLANAPPKTQAEHNPFENEHGARLAGKKLYEEHCAECHGRAALGGRRGPSLRAWEVQKSASGAIFWILSNGVVRRGMPDWSKLPEPERWQIVTFLKSLGASATAQPAIKQR